MWTPGTVIKNVDGRYALVNYASIDSLYVIGITKSKYKKIQDVWEKDGWSELKVNYDTTIAEWPDGTVIIHMTIREFGTSRALCTLHLNTSEPKCSVCMGNDVMFYPSLKSSDIVDASKRFLTAKFFERLMT